MTLFKYLGPDGIEFLDSGKIRFTPPEYFNDPFECKPHVTKLAEKAEFAEFVKQGAEKAAAEGWHSLPSLARAAIPESEYPKLARLFMPSVLGIIQESEPQILDAGVRPALRQLWQAVGVLSLTERRDSLLMWAHYAQSHEGFVVGFDEAHDFFHQKKSAVDELRDLRRVEYRLELPKPAAVDLCATEMYLFKSEEWSYEAEWRIARPQNEADERDSQGRSLFKVPPACLRSVILGCRMTEQDRRRAMDILQRDNYQHVTVFNAKPHETEFRLEFTVVRPGI